MIGARLSIRFLWVSSYTFRRKSSESGGLVISLVCARSSRNASQSIEWSRLVSTWRSFIYLSIRVEVGRDGRQLTWESARRREYGALLTAEAINVLDGRDVDIVCCEEDVDTGRLRGQSTLVDSSFDENSMCIIGLLWTELLFRQKQWIRVPELVLHCSA